MSERAGRLIDTPCPRCKSTNATRVFSGRDRLHEIPGDFHVSECVPCGLWFQNPRVSADEIERLYPDDYTPHLAPPLPSELRPVERWVLHHELGYRHIDTPASEPASSEKRRERRDANIRLDPRFAANGLVVEIGSASGWRLIRLRDLGWSRVEGIEIAAQAAEVARAGGFFVQSTSAEEGLARYGGESVDAFIASMVLEHMIDPFAVVATMANALKPGGELLFSTVLRDGLDARIWGTYWRNLDLPRHMVWLRKRDILAMLEPAFENVRLVHHAEPIDFFGSARYRQKEKRVLFDSLITRFIGEGDLPKPVKLLAALGLTSRVSVRARKRAR